MVEKPLRPKSEWGGIAYRTQQMEATDKAQRQAENDMARQALYDGVKAYKTIKPPVTRTVLYTTLDPHEPTRVDSSLKSRSPFGMDAIEPAPKFVPGRKQVQTRFSGKNTFTQFHDGNSPKSMKYNQERAYGPGTSHSIRGVNGSININHTSPSRGFAMNGQGGFTREIDGSGEMAMTGGGGGGGGYGAAAAAPSGALNGVAEEFEYANVRANPQSRGPSTVPQSRERTGSTPNFASPFDPADSRTYNPGRQTAKPSIVNGRYNVSREIRVKGKKPFKSQMKSTNIFDLPIKVARQSKRAVHGTAATKNHDIFNMDVGTKGYAY